ncbi:MAG: SCP2 sterol-binding domain-containing protein [Solirubrobacteraceae bacterium]
MTDATADFFDDLARRGHEPLLEKLKGSVSFELRHDRHTDHWCVSVENGHVEVSSEVGAADATLRADREVFDRLASGEINVQAALLREAVDVEGDLEMLMLFQRVFPGPPRARRRKRRAGDARGRR